MRFYIEEMPLGTAGSVKNAREFLDETFVVMSGDVITDVNIKEVYEFHRKKGSKVTLVLKRVDIPLEYGVVIIDKEGAIIKFLEKPSWGEVFSDTVNTGIYIIEPEILNLIPEGKAFDFSKDLFPLLLEKGIPMYGYVTKGYWCDIGNTEQYLSSHMDILEGKVDLGYKRILMENGTILGKNVIWEGAKIIPPVILGDGVEIEEGAEVGPNVVAGNGSIIKKGSRVKNSVLWEEVYIGSGSQVEGSILCNKVRVGEGAAILENSVIGEGTRIKDFATIKPGVKIWPFKVVERESIISEDVVWGNNKKTLTFGYRGIKGSFNDEISPYQSLEIGGAFGDIIKGDVIVGSDKDPVSSLIVDLIAYGLVFSGCRVLKNTGTLLPALRWGIRNKSAKGGVYVERDKDNLRILFLNEKGMDVDRNVEKKLENKLKIHDVTYKGVEELKTIEEVDLDKEYVQYLLGENNKKVNLKVKPYDDWTRSMLANLTGGENLLEDDYIFQVKLDKNGEKFEIYDEKGRKFDEDEINYLRLLIAKEKGFKRVVFPFNSSRFLVEFAEELAVETRMGKISPKDFMKAIDELEEGREEYFNLAFDGLNFILSLGEYLELQNRKLSEIKEEFPLRFKMMKKIKCDWKDKGKVIKELFNERGGEEVKFLDGLRFEGEEGWILIVPDSEGPYLRVYVEAGSLEEAEKLFNFYEKKVQNVLLKNDGK
jgi:mannose-1-phosphate guanylyltransferase/phosphomannomutase